MKRALAAAVSAAVLFLAGACSRDALGPGEARLRVSGRVLVDRGDGLRPAKDGRVRHGDRILVADGSAVVDASRGTRFELRSGTDLRFAAVPSLLAGDLLAVSGSRPVTVEAAGSSLRVAGAARLSRSLAVSARAYRGDVGMVTAGRSFTLRPLRQAAIAALGIVPTTAAPIAYDAGDGWDRRFLGGAIALGDQLHARGVAFGPNVPGDEGRTAGFYRSLLPRLEGEPQFDQALVNGRAGAPVGETLVGVTIAASGSRGDFASRWASVFNFRGEGAHWGLVALDQGVADGDAVVATLDAAIGRAPLRFTAAQRGGAAAQPPATAGPPGPGGSPAPPGPRPSPPPEAPPPGGDPGDEPPDGPVPPAPGPVAPVVQPVVDSINGLLSSTTTALDLAGR